MARTNETNYTVAVYDYLRTLGDPVDEVLASTRDGSPVGEIRHRDFREDAWNRGADVVTRALGSQSFVGAASVAALLSESQRPCSIDH